MNDVTATIRAARPGDLGQIRRIYAYARGFMAGAGNPTQWGNTHPPVSLLREDIRAGRLFVLTQNGRAHAVFALLIGEDPTYAAIEGGAWLADTPYGTLHRVARDGEVRGAFGAILRFSAARIPHLRIDTHADNAVMRHVIGQNGFLYCGIIRVADGSPRLAYERL